LLRLWLIPAGFHFNRYVPAVYYRRNIRHTLAATGMDVPA
jgi:hypothetical protein